MDDTSSVETQPKKPYTPPELIEHGTVEEITGFDGIMGSIIPT